MTRLYGWAAQGGVAAETDSLLSDNLFLESFPGATVTFYLTGTLTLATIYEDDIGTPKANPFTADSDTGYWFAYAQAGVFDIQFSGAGIVTPFTLGGVDCPTDFVPPLILTSASGITLTVSQTGGGLALSVPLGEVRIGAGSLTVAAGSVTVANTVAAADLHASGTANIVGEVLAGSLAVDGAASVGSLAVTNLVSTGQITITGTDGARIDLYAGATHEAIWSAGASAALTVTTASATTALIVYQTGDVQVPIGDLDVLVGSLHVLAGSITALNTIGGSLLHSSGNVIATGEVLAGSLSIDVSAAIGGNLSVAGQTHTDSLVVDAGASIHALTLGTGGLTITGNLAVSGQTHTDTLVVDSVATINSLTIGAGGLNVAGNLAVAGQMHSDSLQVDANGAILALTVTDLSVINGAGDGKITIKGTTGIEVDCYTGSTLEAIWSAGATSAFTVTTAASVNAFVVLQTGVVEYGGVEVATHAWVLAQIAALAAAHGTYSVAGGGGGTVTI